MILLDNEVDGASLNLWWLWFLLDSDNNVTKQMQDKIEKKKVIVTFAFAGVVKCSACVS